jgi:SAM-dependent MidA family methyltransferase
LNAACFDATRYCIVEPSPALAEKQRERLGSGAGAPACVSLPRRPAGSLIDKVEWFATQRDLPRWTGVHFSNELIDAFPVHVVTWNGDVWMEKHVAFADGAFVFTDQPLSSPRLAEACAAIPRPLIGATTEINLAARDWVAETAAQMERGCIVAVDYGWESEEYHAPTRTTGTLSAYANHKREDNPLARPGEIDLTAHVNFSDLADAALASGMKIAGFTDQHHFMVGLGEHHFADGANAEDVRAFKTLMHPQFMGLAFKVIAFTKSLSGPLTGFRYARKSAIGAQ